MLEQLKNFDVAQSIIIQDEDGNTLDKMFCIGSIDKEEREFVFDSGKTFTKAELEKYLKGKIFEIN